MAATWSFFLFVKMFFAKIGSENGDSIPCLFTELQVVISIDY